ncbi:MAG: Hsp70 family protein, partial [Myxococcota bacterium]
VKEFFGKKPSKGVHPDEVVALGAAIQGDSLVNNDEEKEELLLLDVTSHSLGIKTSGGAFYKIIEANTTIPTSEKQIFTNVVKNQQAVKIIVFQGENSIADKNELLGEFTLTGLRPAEKGELDIEISFDINANGIVTVQAKDLATGKMQEITITAKSNLSDQEIKDIIKKNKENKNITDGNKNKNQTPKTEVPQKKEQSKPRKRKNTADISSNFSPNMGTPTAKVPKPAPLDDSANISGMPSSQNDEEDVIFSTKPVGSLNFDTVNIKSGIKKIENQESEKKSDLAEPAIVTQTEDNNKNKLEKYLKMIRENLVKVEPLIENTSYGPEALKKAKESLEEGQEIIDAGLGESTSEFQSCEKKLKRISSMFKTILQRLS